MLRQSRTAGIQRFFSMVSRPLPGVLPERQRQCALPYLSPFVFRQTSTVENCRNGLFRVFCEDALSDAIEDLTVTYEENGQEVIKELDKVILSKGAWTTIIFRYQEWRPQTNSYGPDKYVIRRYKKVGGEYRPQSKFNISSADQARKIIEALQSWIGESDENREKEK